MYKRATDGVIERLVPSEGGATCVSRFFMCGLLPLAHRCRENVIVCVCEYFLGLLQSRNNLRRQLCVRAIWGVRVYVCEEYMEYRQSYLVIKKVGDRPIKGLFVSEKERIVDPTPGGVGNEGWEVEKNREVYNVQKCGCMYINIFMYTI